MLPDEKPAPVSVRVCSAADAAGLGSEFATRWQGQVAGRWELLTAWRGPRLVGSACLRWEGPFNPEVAAARPGQVELGFLQVEVDCRGQGTGTALILLAYERCRQRGVTSLGLGVADDNPQAAALYRRLGFVDTGLRFTDTYIGIAATGARYPAVDAGAYFSRQLPTHAW